MYESGDARTPAEAATKQICCTLPICKSARRRSNMRSPAPILYSKEQQHRGDCITVPTVFPCRQHRVRGDRAGDCSVDVQQETASSDDRTHFDRQLTQFFFAARPGPTHLWVAGSQQLIVMRLLVAAVHGRNVHVCRRPMPSLRRIET